MKNSQFKTPILLLVFNRPDTTQRVFDAIREHKPKYLYVAADGARTGVPGERIQCERTRNIVKEVDWECEVRTLFRDENLGCGGAVSGALTWFFDQVEEGIILEDDCLPHPDFFSYCEELLEKYRNEERVMFIGGNNFQDGIQRGEHSYYFSAFNHVWGWASWRSVWKKYDFGLDSEREEVSTALRHYFMGWIARRYWKRIVALVKRGKIDTWDYQLTYTIWKNFGLSVVPNVNLVTNIGFGEGATHTEGTNSQFSNMETGSIMPLQHPVIIERNLEADTYYMRKIKAMSSITGYGAFLVKTILPRKIVRKIKKYFGT